MTTASDNINRWINDSVNASEHEWVVLTFRADGTVRNGSGIRQTLWSNSASSSIDKVVRALDWTITEERRKHKKRLGFAAWLGGDAKNGVQDHIHALLEIPARCDKEEIRTRLCYLWKRNLQKLFKQDVHATVYLDDDSVSDTTRYASYCGRREGNVSIGSADNKFIISRSLSL